MGPNCRKWAEDTYQFISYKGYVITPERNKLNAIPSCFQGMKLNNEQLKTLRLEAEELKKLKQKIDKSSNIKIIVSTKVIFSYFVYRTFRRILGKINRLIYNRFIIKLINFCKKVHRFFAYPRRKFKDIRNEGLYFEKDIYSLILNLNNYFKNAPMEKVILLVSNPLEYKFFKLFIKMKLVPKVSLLLINDLHQENTCNSKLFASQQTYIQNLDIFLNNQIQPIVV